MGQQDVPDEVILQRAKASADRLLEHLSRYAAGPQGEGTGARAPGELEAAITSLRNLATAMDKESQSR